MNPRVGGAAGYGGVQNKDGNANSGQARQVKCYNYNGRGHIARNCTQLKCPQNSKYYKDKMLLMQAQENGANDLDAFDSDVDEAPMAQTMFIANLSSADPVTDEARPSYDLDILSEVQDHDHYQDAVCAHHEKHAMHESVQLNNIVDSYADYTSDSNMILYDQYVKENKVPVVHSNVSSVPNDAYMMIYNDMYEPHAQLVSNTSWNTIVENSLTAELATYKEQVKLKHDAIERKKPSYSNDNLIAKCLSKEVFSVEINSELNVARFTEMHVANTIVEARCLELEVELANLYKDTPDFDSVFVIGKMQASLQGKDNVIRQLKKQISELQETRSDTDRTLIVRTTDSQITQLTEQVTNL
nr:hypothetical protein [Tanacetum cinerariifolium]